jgi:hypothetical protein
MLGLAWVQVEGLDQHGCLQVPYFSSLSDLPSRDRIEHGVACTAVPCIEQTMDPLHRRRGCTIASSSAPVSTLQRFCSVSATCLYRAA